MKNARILLFAFLGAITLNSCGENQKQGEEADDPGLPMQNEMHTDHDGEMSATNANLDDGAVVADVSFSNESLDPVFNHYMHIKTALVNSNPEEAQSGAEMLTQALNNVEGNGEAISAAREIAQTDNLNDQRTSFVNLTQGVETLVSGSVTTGEIYKQYCPMAFDGQGAAWLSASQEVRNPYFGDKMLKCGSVRDTIQ